MRFSENDHLRVGDNNIINPMFTVWETLGESPSSAIFWSLVDRYKITNVVFGGNDNLHFLKRDTPDKNQHNVLSINGTAGKAHAFCPHGAAELVIFGLQEMSDEWYENISIANDKGINVYVDYSWEQIPQWKIDNEDFIEYCLDNNIKFLANCYDIRPSLNPKSSLYNTIDRKTKKPNCKKFLETNMVNTKEVHEFFTRVSVNHTTNSSWNLARCPVDWKDKKYMFSGMIGECRKLRNSLLIAGLHQKGLIENNRWSWLAGYDPYYQDEDDPKNDIWYMKYLGGDKKWWHNEDEDIMSIIDYFYDNVNDIIRDNPFEKQTDNFKLPYSNDICYYNDGDKQLDVYQERRIPQEIMESHLYVTQESNPHPGFFTEKTFKPIMLGLPFVVCSGACANTILKNEYGYEIFEEIIDYSFENDINVQQDSYWSHIKNVTKLVDELDRINKEGPGLFDNKIVQEKVRYNQDLFYKRTTTDRLLSKVKEWYQ